VNAGSTDIAFGLALSAQLPDLNEPPTLRMPQEPPGYGYRLTNAFGTLAFTDPIAIVTPPGETNRIFVVEQAGRIGVITNLAAPTRTVFLDIASRIIAGGEEGLLGLAFHPGFATNRQFYIFYTVNASSAQGSNARHDRLSRMLVSPTNPNVADPSSELVLLEQYDEAGNHNGGDLHFGNDGYLYVSLGDEGGGDDTTKTASVSIAIFSRACCASTSITAQRAFRQIPIRRTRTMPRGRFAIAFRQTTRGSARPTSTARR
jgi:glucose/arabinose dehydrogenase